MKKNIVKTIAFNSLIAALYCTLALPFANLNYGIVNIRIAEVLVILAMYNRKYFYGLVVGCFVVNIFSSLPMDMLIGTFQTLVACFILYYIKPKGLALFLATLSCGLIIGFELYYFLDYEFFVACGSVLLSEFIILVFGYYLFKMVFRNDKIKDMLIY